ncbi:EAL domain-containing protein [Aurantiacibacter spongiae]|uniref:EAL domain-containing protein n=2 Tax=Aurantiacibacter spongiae TaxID=2488860 RepID=A0A3N5DTU0_9SPHN|nr:EAL domain-containing protein [Aurantiacibacter spongiae]
MPQIVRSWMGTGAAPDMVLTNAVLLNIALLIFGWRRYRDLNREVAERRAAEVLARELAERDPLTDCLNRRSGPAAIDRLAAEARATGRDVAVLMIDLDNFKQINDLNGHKTGDRVLVAFAQRIGALIPADGIVARIGGDEFALAVPFLLPEREGLDAFVTHLIEAVSAPVEADGIEVDATVSVGIAHGGGTSGWNERAAGVDPDAPGDADTLLHRADIAMYHAKKRGRNRYYWFEPQMEDELRFRNELERGIRAGIANGEFVPFYEQQIDLETGGLVGFEMLARWKSPRYSLVSPAIFIPIAEEIDLIGTMSEQLIRQALRDAQGWHPDLSLSVNISPLQLRDPWFAQKLLHLLVESGFPAHRLEIEITETCLHENIGAVRTIVTSLKNQGIRISLDDFGTGYSSLAQLRTLPFDRLKIDRSFVTELSDRGAGMELVRAIVSLGKGLSLPVTAEGVENAEVLKVLKGLGGMKGQGYLYGKPEDAHATRQRLAKRGLLAEQGRDGDGDGARPRVTALRAG